MDARIEDKKVIESSGAPGAVGPYFQTIQFGNLFFTSGQLPIDPANGIIPEGLIALRAHQAIKNISAFVVEVGACLGDIVTTTVFLTDIADFPKVNEL